MALRQTTGFVESLLRLIDLDWAVPNLSTLRRRQKSLKVNIPYRGSAGPLHPLIDSKGIKVEGEGEWNARKHGGFKRRVWRKIHIGMNEQTLEIRAAEFTASDAGDAPCCRNLWARYRPNRRSPTSPPKPRRSQDALCETAGSAPHGAGLRPPGVQVPGPCRSPERLHGLRNTRH